MDFLSIDNLLICLFFKAVCSLLDFDFVVVTSICQFCPFCLSLAYHCPVLSNSVLSFSVLSCTVLSCVSCPILSIFLFFPISYYLRSLFRLVIPVLLCSDFNDLLKYCLCPFIKYSY